jgi:flagellar protein FlaG
MEIDAISPISQYNRIDSLVGQWRASIQAKTDSTATTVPTNSGTVSTEISDEAMKEHMERFKEEIAKQLEALDAVLSFRRDEESGEMIAEVRDRATGEVLRQVPPEEMLRAAKTVREFLGMVVDARH